MNETLQQLRQAAKEIRKTLGSKPASDSTIDETATIALSARRAEKALVALAATLLMQGE